MATTPNVTAYPIEAGLLMTTAMGEAAQTLYTSPTVGQIITSGSGQMTFAGGAKVTRLTAINKDTSTANVFMQVSKSIGGVSVPLGDPVGIGLATAKGAMNSLSVDLLTAIYGAGGVMNLAPGTILQVTLSVAIGASGLYVIMEGAAF